MVLPAFVQPWFEGYRSNPQYLLTAIVVLGGLTMAANALRVRTDDRMRAQWAHLHNGGDAPATWSRTHGIIHATRTASWYRSFFRFLKRHLLPDAIGIAFFVAGFLILSRVVVAIASSLGGACTPAATPAAFDAKGIARPAAEFTTSDRCWGSGVALAEGARYRLELVRSTEWKDGDGGDAAIGMRGDEARGLRGHVLLPFRRQLGRSWFQPIARIGVDGEDEYPLDPVVGVAAAENPNRIVTELTARTSGELFLYVNDGVLLWPSLWKVFYANNQGRAAITVQRLPQPDIPE